MRDTELSARDLAFLAARGISAEQARRQLALLESPPPPVRLVRPCTVGDGIVTVPERDHARLLALHARAARGGRLTKMVPASGAASRMFAPLLAALDSAEPVGADEPPGAVRDLLENLSRFAFSEELRTAAHAQRLRVETLRREGRWRELLRLLLGSEGLGYAAAPKGLVVFHRAREAARTAFVEHLVEGAGYVADGEGRCRYHFTVPADTVTAFEAALDAAREGLERRLGVRLDVTFSVQDTATDTLAVDLDGNLARLSSGEAVLRPGGHGALLANLGQLGGDVVFVKNIDNVLPERGQALVVLWQRLLAGVLLDFEGAVRAHLAALEDPEPPAAALDEAQAFLASRFGSGAPSAVRRARRAVRRAWLVDHLARPLRVCGMVRNEGEPGGGPFWVAGASGEERPQIVEASQVGEAPHQHEILRAATHFNPVNLVCSLLDQHGRPYDLERFVDPSTAFVSRKFSGGEELKVLEWPGLWNGAMARWNTVFVEVPGATFAPVKTVFDLLRPDHQ